VSKLRYCMRARSKPFGSRDKIDQAGVFNPDIGDKKSNSSAYCKLKRSGN
jgi:hypothetical protein